MIRKTLFLWIFFLFTFQSHCTPLAEQFERAGYLEICDMKHGTAGLSATVYALIRFWLERHPIRDQARNSALENFLGFPQGIIGAELTERARLQAVEYS